MGSLCRWIVAVLLLPWLVLDPVAASSLRAAEAFQNPPLIRRNLPQAVFDQQALAAADAWSDHPVLREVAFWSRRAAEALRPDPDKPLIAVMDLHGVLLNPTWRDEYAHAYQKLAGGTIETAREWVEREAVGVEDPELFRKLARELKIPYKRIEARFRKSQQELQDRSNPKAKEGALEFVKALRARGVDIIVISGSPTAAIRRQLEMRGFLPYIKPEHIIGRDAVQRMGATGSYRDRAIEELANQFPDHRMIYFNDWTGSFDLVKRMGGRIFGMPQSSGAENERYRKALIERGADFLMDGWKAWSWLIENLAISKEQQDAARAKILPLARHAARELPFLFGAPLEPKRGLLIEVSHDLKRLYYLLMEANGNRAPLWDFASHYLVSPLRYIAHFAPASVRDQILELWKLNRRVTVFRGIETDWDKSVDRDVWAFNIDTGHLHATEEDTELFERMDVRTIRRVAEIGSGGGHGTKMLLQRLPYLEELAFTDISLHALAATMRNLWSLFLASKVVLHPYWGKGIRALSGWFDYIKVNPPYIPALPGDGDEGDPYRGTGLIREILEVGASKLNPYNPEASIVINISSLTRKDWDAYLKQYGGQWVIEPLGEARTVPLKIGAIADNPKWLDFLIREHGLVKKENPQSWQEPYEHTIQCYRLRPRLSVPEVLDKEIADYEAMEQAMREPGGPSWRWVGGEGPSAAVKRLGVFGITADPVQNGHKDLIETALRDGVEEVVIVLAFDNVNKLKASSASIAERMAMIRRTFGGNPKIHFAFSKNPRFIDFLAQMKTQRPEATPVFLMGADSFQTMASYNSNEDFQTFVRQGAEFRVYPRYGDEEQLRRLWSEDAEHWPEEFTSRVFFARLSALPASSSLVRALAGDGDPLWKELVPQAVAQVIELRRLYGHKVTTEARAKAYLEYTDWISGKFRNLKLKDMAEWLKVRPQRKALENAQRPAGYPARRLIPDDFRSWKIPFPEYRPSEQISKKSKSKPRPAVIPLNPLGRTGLAGSGELWYWGENEAADLYLTRENPVTGKIEYLSVRRADNGKFCSPGGFVDPKEEALATAIREAGEEAHALGNFRDAELIYDGPVDDPRNTDNAWITSKVFWKHLTPEEAAALDLRPDNKEVTDVQWLPFEEEGMDGMHASHPEFARLVMARMKANPPALERKERASDSLARPLESATEGRTLRSENQVALGSFEGGATPDYAIRAQKELDEGIGEARGPLHLRTYAHRRYPVLIARRGEPATLVALPRELETLLQRVELKTILEDAPVAAAYGYHLNDRGEIDPSARAKSWLMAFEINGDVGIRMRLADGTVRDYRMPGGAGKVRFLRDISSLQEFADGLIKPRTAAEASGLAYRLYKGGLEVRYHGQEKLRLADFRQPMETGAFNIPRGHALGGQDQTVRAYRWALRNNRWALIIREGAQWKDGSTDVPWLLVHDDAPNRRIHLYRSNGESDTLTEDLPTQRTPETAWGTPRRIRAKGEGPDLQLHRSALARSFYESLKKLWTGRSWNEKGTTMGDRFKIELPIWETSDAFLVRRTKHVPATEGASTNEMFLFSGNDSFLQTPLAEIQPGERPDLSLMDALKQGVLLGLEAIGELERHATLRFRIPYQSDGELWINLTGNEKPDLIFKIFTSPWRRGASPESVKYISTTLMPAAFLYVLNETGPLTRQMREISSKVLHLLKEPGWWKMAVTRNIVQYAVIEWTDHAPPWIIRDEAAEWAAFRRLRALNNKLAGRIKEITFLRPFVERLAMKDPPRGKISRRGRALLERLRRSG